MNQKVRYTYTYFIHTFQIKNMKKYLTSLFTNKNIRVKLFEKEKDIDVYTYFSEEAKEEFFESFKLEKEDKNKIEKMNNKQKAKYFSKQNTIYLEYNNEQILPAKLGEKDRNIFFNRKNGNYLFFNRNLFFSNENTNRRY